MLQQTRAYLFSTLAVLLCLFTIAEVNRPHLAPLTQLSLFALLGTVLCFLRYPAHPRLRDNELAQCADLLLALATVVCFGYVAVQSEPIFSRFWSLGQSLGDRAGRETNTDIAIGVAGLVLVLEATRRSIGIALPILACAFIAHAYYGPELPDWLLPHRQVTLEQIVAVTYLRDLGVFGTACYVMFTYVFLFVIFGAFLEATGATQFIVDFAARVFGKSAGGPAKVAVLGSGLMGSLSGSAVANAVTTGTFTIPMMRNAGFPPHVAGGITAAAASGGALVPPVMGAGAYMMLEIVDPPVTFLQVAKAAVIPAVLYYFSILMIVHFYARRTRTAEVTPSASPSGEQRSLLGLIFQFEGVIFLGALASLIVFLVMGYTPFRAVTLSLGVILVLGLVHPRKRLTWRTGYEALVKAANNGVSLVSASTCVGIVIGIVITTGIATDFNMAVKGLVEHSLLLALIGIMACSIVLGMGVPSVVCYLLMATMMGSLLRDLGVIPLAAHMFIFYFGMMSMVTPPVALAAYASAAIAGAPIMRTSFSSFLFSLVGFSLPFMFVYRPELLLMSNKPDLTISEKVDADAGHADLAIIHGTLRRTGQELGDARIDIKPVGGAGTRTSATTDSQGRCELRLAEGGYDILVAGSGDDAILLGTLTVERGRLTPPSSADSPNSPLGIRFRDQRLSLLQVLYATAIAAAGIVALAAGIAGYLFSRLAWVARLFAFVAAAVMLLPERGFQVGPIHAAFSDLSGLLLFGMIAAINASSGE